MAYAPIVKANIHDLHHAIVALSWEDVQHVLEICTMDINTTVCGTTALSLSLYKDKPAVFKMMLCHQYCRGRLDINKLSKDDKQRLEPPLVTACRLGNPEAVHLLVQHGADLEGTDNFQHTPLWMATRQRHLELVTFLLNSGVNVNPSNVWTHSPLFFAVKYSSKRTDIAKVLIYNGAEVKLNMLKSGPSLLYCAIIQGDMSIARLIVDAGYNVSADDKVREEFAAGTLTRNRTLIDWLVAEMKTPTALQRQCRLVIRHAVCSSQNGCYFRQGLEKLPLPRTLIAYLSLAEEFNASMET